MYKVVSDQKSISKETYHCFFSKVTFKLSSDSFPLYITYLQWATKILSSNCWLMVFGSLLVVCGHLLVVRDHLCTVTCTEEATQMAAKCLQKTSIYIYIYIHIQIYANTHMYIYIYPFTYMYHRYTYINIWYIYVNGYINIYYIYIYI